jgi:glycosyltransferase involved in cell wall biosynthesis
MRRSDRIRLEIVGGGPTKDQLFSLAASLGVQDRVDFLGYQHDIDKVFSSADVLLQPSEEEPFGMAIIEASAAGVLPVAFADGGGALEVLPPDGVVVRDIDGLGSLLEGLFASPVLTEEARQQRAEWTRDRFSIKATAGAYENVYRSVLQGK